MKEIREFEEGGSEPVERYQRIRHKERNVRKGFENLGKMSESLRKHTSSKGLDNLRKRSEPLERD